MNFQNVLPVANVSPFMFALSPLLLILPRCVRKHALLLVSLLSVGMMLSSVFGCIYNASINYAFLYFFGMCGVLLMGFGFSKIFADEKFRITNEEKNPTGSEKVSTTV